MKVLVIGTAHPYKGGLAQFNEKLAEEFNNIEGNEVKIYTFTLQYPSFLYPGETQYSDEPFSGNYPIKRAINSVNPLNWLKVGKEIAKKKYDLIIIKYWIPFMGPAFGTILRQVKKNKHTKVVCILDNIIPHEKRFGDKLFTKYFIKPVDAFISMSRSVLEDLKTFDNKKPALYTPHPMYDNYGLPIVKSEARKALELPEDEKVILFFGFIRKYKGLDILLDAMAHPAIRENNIKLLIAGEYYGNAKEYEDQIEKLGISDLVYQHTYFIANRDVNKYFSAADLVVQPYRTATQSGISQIAYYFEKPMIVTEVGGLPEIVPHEKVGLVCPIDAKTIAENILYFYQENKAEEFANNIKEEKKKYEWEEFINNVLGLYEKVK